MRVCLQCWRGLADTESERTGRGPVKRDGRVGSSYRRSTSSDRPPPPGDLHVRPTFGVSTRISRRGARELTGCQIMSLPVPWPVRSGTPIASSLAGTSGLPLPSSASGPSRPQRLLRMNDEEEQGTCNPSCPKRWSGSRLPTSYYCYRVSQAQASRHGANGGDRSCTGRAMTLRRCGPMDVPFTYQARR